MQKNVFKILSFFFNRTVQAGGTKRKREEDFEQGIRKILRGKFYTNFINLVLSLNCLCFKILKGKFFLVFKFLVTV